MKLPPVSIELDTASDEPRPVLAWSAPPGQNLWYDRLLRLLQDALDGTVEGEALSEDLVEMLEAEEAATRSQEVFHSAR